MTDNGSYRLDNRSVEKCSSDMSKGQIREKSLAGYLSSLAKKSSKYQVVNSEYKDSGGYVSGQRLDKGDWFLELRKGNDTKKVIAEMKPNPYAAFQTQMKVDSLKGCLRKNRPMLWFIHSTKRLSADQWNTTKNCLAVDWHVVLVGTDKIKEWLTLPQEPMTSGGVPISDKHVVKVNHGRFASDKKNISTELNIDDLLDFLWDHQ